MPKSCSSDTDAGPRPTVCLASPHIPTKLGKRGAKATLAGKRGLPQVLLTADSAPLEDGEGVPHPRQAGEQRQPLTEVSVLWAGQTENTWGPC